MQIKQILLRTFINGLAGVIPAVSARLSYQLWTRTYRHKTPEREMAVYQSARKQILKVNGADIMTYAWNMDKNRPHVLLLHGWGGRGTQLHSFVQALVSANFSVLAFDAYGHGLSGGNHTNVLQSVEIINRLTEIHGDFFAMIGHSFGAMTAVNAVSRGVNCSKIIGISPPTEFFGLLQVFSQHLGLSEKARMVLEKHVLTKYGINSLDEISITGLAPTMTLPCLIIHDKNDDRVPLSQSQKAVALWGVKSNGAGAKLHITEGLGHVRILNKPAVIKTSMSFLAE